MHASIQERRGRRALYYDLDLVLHWTGHCALGEQTSGEEVGHAAETTAHTMQGEFRLYNVGQDTQFHLGGDPHTSYLYTVGVPGQFHNDERCELWARHLKYEASELFELVSTLVGQVVTDLVRKAERHC